MNKRVHVHVYDHKVKYNKFAIAFGFIALYGVNL